MTEYKTTWADMAEHRRQRRSSQIYPDPEVPEGDRWELFSGPVFDDDYMIWTWRRTVDPQPESEVENGRH